MARAWLLAALVVALAGCSAWPSPNLTVTFPAIEGDLNIGPLRVVLLDRTGLATGVQVATDQEGALGFPVTGGIEAVPGDANASFVSWVGGACSERARLTFMDGDGTYQLRISEDPTLIGMIGCAALGVPRSIKITFIQPLDPALVSVAVTYN